MNEEIEELMKLKRSELATLKVLLKRDMRKRDIDFDNDDSIVKLLSIRNNNVNSLS